MRILIAEDDPISQRLLQSTLTKWGYEVLVTSDGREALDELSKNDPPRLGVLDWMMPRLSGPDVCREARQLAGGEYFYFILLTAKGRKEDLVAGLEAGADDYVVKPFDPRELKVRIRCAQRIIELQSQIVNARDALHEQATHDALTGLLNRSAVFDALEAEMSRCQRLNERPDPPQHLAVIMLDLDHFKSINDTLGHAAGDQVLRQTAQRIRRRAREYDQVGRYGGEEFLFLLPATDQQQAVCQAERIRSVIAETPFAASAEKLNVTASFGVAATDAHPDADSDELVRRADEALYRAKEAGRNRVQAAEAIAEQFTG